MRSILILVIVLHLTFCQYNQYHPPQGAQVQQGRPSATPTRQVVRGPQTAPVRASQPATTLSQIPPADDNSKFVEAFISMFFEQFKNINIDRYETEDGVLTNLKVKVTPPTPSNIIFRYSESDDRIYFLLKGVSASLESDADLLYGTVTGHLSLSLSNLDIELRTDPAKIGNLDAIHIDYRLHLKDADIKADLKTVKDESGLPTGFDQFGPMLGNLQGSYKVMSSKVLDDVFRHNSVEEVSDFLNRLTGNY